MNLVHKLFIVNVFKIIVILLFLVNFMLVCAREINESVLWSIFEHLLVSSLFVEYCVTFLQRCVA